jgi:iron complex transport system ATP-binding protein
VPPTNGAVVLLSSHDLGLSRQFTDSVWLLDGRGGLSVGTAEQLIADGHVGRAFDTDAVRFSRAPSRFEFVQ